MCEREEREVVFVWFFCVCYVTRIRYLCARSGFRSFATFECVCMCECVSSVAFVRMIAYVRVGWEFRLFAPFEGLHICHLRVCVVSLCLRDRRLCLVWE